MDKLKGPLREVAKCSPSFLFELELDPKSTPPQHIALCDVHLALICMNGFLYFTYHRTFAIRGFLINTSLPKAKCKCHSFTPGTV